MWTQARTRIALAWLLVPCVANAAPIYSLAPIAPANPGDSIYPVAMNDRGEVVGAVAGKAADGSPTYRPFFWDGTAPARDLVAPAGTTGDYPYGYAINNLGQVVAKVGNDLVVWSRDGSARTVPLPASPSAGVPAGLNDAGTIVTTGGFRIHADGRVEALPGFGGVALNQAGAALGHREDESLVGPVVWEPDGTVRPLSTAGVTYELGRDINDAGWATGMIFSGDSGNVALWRPDGTLSIATNATREPDGADGYAINNRGEVVGYGFKHSLYWSEADGAVDLQTRLDASGAGWLLAGGGRDINDAGQIIVPAYRAGDPTFRTHGVLLTPVPEPGMALAFVGMSALIVMRRHPGRRPRLRTRRVGGVVSVGGGGRSDNGVVGPGVALQSRTSFSDVAAAPGGKAARL